MRRLLVPAVLAAFVLGGCGGDEPVDDSLKLTVEQGDDAGTGSALCMPVSQDGVASFAWESVHNTATEAVEVVEVSVDDDEVEVVDWFLVPENWTEAGVSRGALPSPGQARLPNTLGAGNTALVAMSVQAENLAAARDMVAQVEFEGPDGAGTITLDWALQVLPADQECGAS